MTSLTVGIQTRCLRLPLRRALETARRLDAAGVQIDLRTELPLADCSRSAIREIRKLLDDTQLQVASVAFPTRRGFSDETDLDRRVAAARQAMEVGGQLGARALVTRVGPLPSALDAAEAQPLIESLTALALHGERVGCRLAARTGADAPQDLAQLIDALPDGTVGVDLAPASLVREGHTPLTALELLGPRVNHVTAADALPDSSAGGATEVSLGRGMVDFPELLAALDQYGYHGWLTIERGETPNPTAEVGAAVEYLHTVLRGD